MKFKSLGGQEIKEEGVAARLFLHISKFFLRNSDI
jgi:hypothetical protein